MIAILGVILLATTCLSSEPSNITNIESNGRGIKNLYGLKDIIKNLGIDVNEIKELSTLPNNTELVQLAKLTTPEIVQKYGYTSEVHKIKTKAGYKQVVHRISGSPKSPPAEGKKVVFLMHGIFDSSATWVLPGPNKGLGFILADEGYDVWLGNSRGNLYSTDWSGYLNIIGSHIPGYLLHFAGLGKLKNYWGFTWHEMGVHDLPANIDYILAKTGQSKLQYIGHSQGTTQFFVMLAEKPEYNDKIEMMHALAPVAFMKHTSSPALGALVPIMDYIKFIASKIGLGFIPPTTSRVGLSSHEPVQIITKHALLTLGGYKTNQLNTTLLPVIFSHVPAGCAADQLIHYGQLIKSGHFRQFDHGIFKNPFYYGGKVSPPDYNLKNVKAPIALYHSPNDWIADSRDVQTLKEALPNVVKDRSVTEANLNHMDFVWGVDAPRIVYDDIIRSMKQFETEVDATTSQK